MALKMIVVIMIDQTIITIVDNDEDDEKGLAI